jgi:hypothetical protein
VGGTYCIAASSAPSACPAGAFCSPAAVAPTPCFLGSYSGAVGAPDNSTCLLCGSGSFSNATGASSAVACAQCPSGAYCSAPGTWSPVGCPPGAYCPPGSVQPTPCQAGTYSAQANASTAATCLTCPFGTYNPATGASTPTACIRCQVHSPTGNVSFTPAAPAGLSNLSLTCGAPSVLLSPPFSTSQLVYNASTAYGCALLRVAAWFDGTAENITGEVNGGYEAPLTPGTPADTGVLYVGSNCVALCCWCSAPRPT